MGATEFSGRLFGPGLPGGGAAAMGCWDFGTLHLRCGAQEFQADPALLELDPAGFNYGETRLSWQDAGGHYAFFLDAAHREAFSATTPPVLAARLAAAAQQRRRLEWRFRLGWMALGIFLLLPFLLIGAFLIEADAVADWVVKRTPAEFEAQIGELTLAQTRAQMKLEDSGTAVQAIRQIGEKLTLGSPHHYRWFVAHSPEINAFAAPGGVVVVNTGLLRATDSAEELAGVLAHEIAHVELRHGLKAVFKNLGLRALLSLALGDYSGTLAGEATASLTEMKFSRDAENQADHAGLQRLAQAGIDPRAMPRFFTKLAGKEGATAKLPALFSTHPLSDERRARLEADIAALPQRQYAPLEMDWGKVKAALAENGGESVQN
ncbi:MAG: M48 family metallopeptidase [Sulfuricella sp.]|nr:M48 family metallopeptidase [Sulfuricella sp.]